MKTVDPVILNRASQSWLSFARTLGIEITAPFFLEESGRTLQCLAFLPHFGGPKGMVVGAMDLPEVTSDAHVFEIAKKRHWFCSFVNARAFAKSDIGEVDFKEALEDWGYFGTPEKRPTWFNGYDHSHSS